jgi:hypothetical protein
MLTNEQADESYQQAFAALHSVVIDPAATPEQQALAREKRDLLTLEFIGHAIANIEERTRQFRKFIGEMNAVIATFGSGSTIAGIRRLQEVVDAAGELIGLAFVPAAGTKTAAKKTATKAARKAPKKATKKAATKAAKKAAKKATKKAAKKATKKAASRAVRKAPKKPARKTPKKQARKVAKKPVKRAAKKPAKRAPGRRARPAKRGR